jgi:alpha-glucosidase (family GH31 glycosyl hydrolase)
MGFPVWGTDTGGYFGGRIDEELYARWLEWSAWNGLFEIKIDDAGGKNQDRPPWVYGGRLQAAFRDACELRMQLLPYVFSLAQTAGRHGVLMKPLAYVWPEDAATHAIADEYLFGPSLLVAPIVQPGGHRTVYLPAGHWFDFYEPARELAGGQSIEVTAPFERIPVFVRANSIYVTGTLPLGSGKNWAPEARPSLLIHATPGDAGERVVFEFVDSFDQNHAKALELRRVGNTVRFTAPALLVPGELLIRANAPAAVKLNGRPVASKYDANTRTLRVAFAADTALEVEVDAPSGN